MMKMSIIKIIVLLFAWNAMAEDLNQVVSGAYVQDSLANAKKEQATNIQGDNYAGKVSNINEPDPITGTNTQNLVEKNIKKNTLKNSGYLPPGAFDKQNNFASLNKGQYTKEFGSKSTSALNLSYFSDSFNYQSQDDIINKTISQGYRHIKAGMLQVRSDHYFYKSFALNTFYAVGSGLSYNSGMGTFITGTKSDATFRLWEVPLDLGIGLEIPIYTWFKITGVGGPSIMLLAQNRSDFGNNEKGKNKYQASYGQFASAQFKINMAIFSDSLSYELFTSSQVTRLSMNLDVRYENYKNFEDADLAISGTSIGAGFTFEFL